GGIEECDREPGAIRLHELRPAGPVLVEDIGLARLRVADGEVPPLKGKERDRRARELLFSFGAQLRFRRCELPFELLLESAPAELDADLLNRVRELLGPGVLGGVEPRLVEIAVGEEEGVALQLIFRFLLRREQAAALSLEPEQLGLDEP